MKFRGKLRSLSVTKRFTIMAFGVVFVLCLGLCVSSTGVRAAYAVSEPPYCYTLLGSWDGTTNICAFSGSYTLASGTLEVTSPTTLAISGGCSFPSLSIDSGATLTIDSGAFVTIDCSSSPGDYGINNLGTIQNHGTMTISGYRGLESDGSFQNYGTITISSTGDAGMSLYSGINPTQTSIFNNY